jgi:hypothetical protein
VPVPDIFNNRDTKQPACNCEFFFYKKKRELMIRYIKLCLDLILEHASNLASALEHKQDKSGHLKSFCFIWR